MGDTSITATEGDTLLNALLEADILISTACVGQGVCKLCKVHIVEGDSSTPIPLEKKALGSMAIANGMRLACRVTVRGPLRMASPK